MYKVISPADVVNVRVIPGDIVSGAVTSRLIIAGRSKSTSSARYEGDN